MSNSGQRYAQLLARLIVGGIFLALILAVLILDHKLAPWYPCLALATALFALAASLELRQLFPEPRPMAWWMHGSIVAILLANWATPFHVHYGFPNPSLAAVALMAVVAMMVAFFAEMVHFRQPNGATHRLAYGALALLWLGLAPSFLLQLRWFGSQREPASSASDPGLWALAFAIFVPKVGDIAAYFVGSALGRHRLAPVLSPKKTWEGAAGGLFGSIAAGWLIASLCQRLTGQVLLSMPMAILVASIVGIVAQLSDLAESLLKRDRQVKDTSTYIPGLGGILDTLDSLLLSAPVTWLLLHICSPSGPLVPLSGQMTTQGVAL